MTSMASAKVIPAAMSTFRVVDCYAVPRSGSVLGAPPARVAVLGIFLPTDGAAEHRPGEPPFIRPQREVDVDHHQRDHRHRGKAMHRVDDTPGVGIKPVWIALPERRVDLEQ